MWRHNFLCAKTCLTFFRKKIWGNRPGRESCPKSGHFALVKNQYNHHFSIFNPKPEGFCHISDKKTRHRLRIRQPRNYLWPTNIIIRLTVIVSPLKFFHREIIEKPTVAGNCSHPKPDPKFWANRRACAKNGFFFQKFRGRGNRLGRNARSKRWQIHHFFEPEKLLRKRCAAIISAS